jgi:glycosyltransferase involved in cell wall biosynthesis
MPRIAATGIEAARRDVLDEFVTGVDGRQVLIIISGLMLGGGQKVALDLLAGARSSRIRARLVLLGCAYEDLHNKASECIRYDGHYNSIVSLLRSGWYLRRRLRRYPGVLIHTHGWDADIIGWIARAGLGTQQLMHLHVTPEWLHSAAFRHRARRWISRRAMQQGGVRVAAVSEAVRQFWASGLDVHPEKFDVVRNGVDVDRFHPGLVTDHLSTCVIGVAARLDSMKGIEFLLDTLGILNEEGSDFRLKVAGEGRLRRSLEERCASRGIDDRTEFLGHVDDMPGFYRTIDIFVLPSVSSEGLPLGVLEAMASGVPVVGTTVGGTPEAVRDAVEGLLVPPRDVSALTVALRRLLENPDERSMMGKAGRARAVDEFSLERFLREIRDLYDEILDESRA